MTSADSGFNQAAINADRPCGNLVDYVESPAIFHGRHVSQMQKFAIAIAPNYSGNCLLKYQRRGTAQLIYFLVSIVCIAIIVALIVPHKKLGESNAANLQPSPKKVQIESRRDEQSAKFVPPTTIRSLDQRFVAGLAAVTVIAALLGVYYWISTAPERLERHAIESLKSRLELSATFGAFLPLELRRGSSKDVVQLQDGKWAKEYFTVQRNNWRVEGNEESVAYPYKGFVDYYYCRWATVYRDSKEQAESDDLFYRANFNSADNGRWSATPEIYKYSSDSRVLTETLLYSKQSGEWILQSTEDLDLAEFKKDK